MLSARPKDISTKSHFSMKWTSKIRKMCRGLLRRSINSLKSMTTVKMKEGTLKRKWGDLWRRIEEARRGRLIFDICKILFLLIEAKIRDKSHSVSKGNPTLINPFQLHCYSSFLTINKNLPSILKFSLQIFLHLIFPASAIQNQATDLPPLYIYPLSYANEIVIISESVWY